MNTLLSQPPDILLQICQHLHPHEIILLMKTNKFFYLFLKQKFKQITSLNYDSYTCLNKQKIIQYSNNNQTISIYIIDYHSKLIDSNMTLYNNDIQIIDNKNLKSNLSRIYSYYISLLHALDNTYLLNSIPFITKITKIIPNIVAGWIFHVTYTLNTIHNTKYDTFFHTTTQILDWMYFFTPPFLRQNTEQKQISYQQFIKQKPYDYNYTKKLKTNYLFTCSYNNPSKWYKYGTLFQYIIHMFHKTSHKEYKTCLNHLLKFTPRNV